MKPPVFREVVKDLCGVQLHVGDWVTIAHCQNTLQALRLDSERSQLFGVRFQIIKVELDPRHGGVWYVTGDGYNLGGYISWPAICVIGASRGLKGLVKRYRGMVST